MGDVCSSCSNTSNKSDNLLTPILVGTEYLASFPSFFVDNLSGGMSLTNEEAFLINIVDVFRRDVIFLDSLTQLG